MIVVVIILLGVGLMLVGVGFFIWKRLLRFAKGIERGIKMVPLLIHLPPPSDDVETSGRDIREVIQERISQAEVLYNLIAGTFKKGFKSKFYGQRHIAFEIIAVNGVIKFFVAVPVALQSVVEQAIQTAYPTARMEEVEDHNIFNPEGKLSGTFGGEVELKEHYAYPIATFTQLKREAIQALINAMTSLQAGDGAAVQILLRPALSGWTKSAESKADSKRNKKDDGPKMISIKDVVQAPFRVPESKKNGGGGDGDKPLSALEQSVVESIEEKTRHPGFEVLIRVVGSSSTTTRAQTIQNNLVAAFALFDAPGLNGFKFKPAKNMEEFVTAFIFRFFPPEQNRSILNSLELATLFHLPDDQFTRTSQVQREFAKQVEAPPKVSTDGTLLGFNVFRGTRKEIRLSDEDRRRHVYIVGQTGTGKSTILKQLIVQDMIDGRGVAFIDPHGDAAEELLAMVPKHRVEDIIYFSPGDMDYPLGLNLFEFQNDEQKDFLIQEAINMLYRLYDPQHQGIIGPIYEHWFRNAALAVMADPAGGTFIDIPKLFLDKQFMRDKLKHIHDPTVLDFWNKEMVQTSGSRQAEILGWFVSKFGAFASNEMMRNIIGQTKSAFDLREVMDGRKILIANLSKGRMGELNSMLLGMIFVMKFQAAAMSRANIPEAERQDFTLYVDEFQNFSTDSFATILAEARKYHLSLVVANQYIGQLEEQVRDAVFGNTGTIVSFRCGPNDADFLVKQFEPAFDARDLVNLLNLNAAVRLMVEGRPSQPFTMALAPFLKVNYPKLSPALKQLSAAKYARPRAEVEAEIFKRLESKPAPNPFESLGMGSSLPPRPPAGSLAAPKTSSSFLDEWLAKRKQAAPTGRPESKPQLTPFAAPDRDYLDNGSPSGSATKPGQPPAFSKHQKLGPHPKASQSQPRTGPKLVPPPPPADLNDILPLVTKPDGLDLLPQFKKQQPADEVKVLQDQVELEQKVSGLQSQTPDETTKPPGLAPKAKIPPLKPGEIYIDEEGIIHQGQEGVSPPSASVS